MQELCVCAQVVDSAENGIVGAICRTAGAHAQQGVCNRAILVVNNPNGHGRRAGRDIGRSSYYTIDHHEISAVHVFGKLAGMCSRNRGCRNSSPDSERIGNERICARSRKDAAQIALIGGVADRALCPRQWRSHARRIKKARACYIFRAACPGQNAKLQHNDNAQDASNHGPIPPRRAGISP